MRQFTYVFRHAIMHTVLQQHVCVCECVFAYVEDGTNVFLSQLYINLNEHAHMFTQSNVVQFLFAQMSYKQSYQL